MSGFKQAYMRTWLRYGLAGLSLALLLFYISRIDYQALIPIIQDAGYGLAWPFLMTVIAYVLSAWAWKFCFPKNKHTLSLRKLFVIRQIGETMGTITPANIIGGDATKLFLLKGSNLPSSEILSSIVVARILNWLSVLFLGVISAYSCWFFNDVVAFGMKQFYIAIGITILFGSLFYILFSSNLILYKIIYKVSISKYEDRLNAIKKYIYRLNSDFYGLYKSQKKELVFAFALTVVHWIFGALEFFILLYLFGFEVGLMDAILIESGVQVLKSTGAFVPAQMGVEEYSTKIMLGLVGCHNLEIWLSICLMRRFRQVIWLGIGGVLIWMTGFIAKKNNKKIIHGNLVRIT